MKTSLLVPFFAASFALATEAGAATWKIDPSHSNAQFTATYMMVTKVRGGFDKLSGTVELDEKDVTKSKVEATIDAASINTRNEKRDGHLRSADFFDVENHPTITFKSTKVKKAGKDKLKVTGDLTIRGVTRPVVLDVELPSKEFAGRRAASATTRINRKDFGVSWNKVVDAGGVMLGDEVEISIELVLKKDEPTAASKS